MPSVDYPNRFYIGRIFDHQSGETSDEPYLYDPDDLNTHGVIVGMTGSGKTGLGLDIMEEAALNDLPAILIDPKGDITNLLLHFPEMLPSDFKPWVNADSARRDGKTVTQAAAETADLWKNGLAGWGIEQDRIEKLRDSVYYTVYTPGSTSGKPISILASLKAPQVEWESNSEALLEQIEGTVTALLSLMGEHDVDPVSDPRHILLAKIIAEAWQNGQDIDLGELIMQTQNPPFEKIGFFAVDQFFPQKDRFKLAMALNNLVAAPSFQPWLTGEPLDVASLLYASDGKPRHTIFYIAHLSEEERMFIVTLLFSAIETWMRSQAGSTSLRALIYFDEIFGYMPPSANPPSKKPMLRMLKQARAFGVGLILATQNPVDIDYKGLSNAGTWMIGRLQTERDKLRLLDGLQSAAGGGFDRQTVDAMLSNLGKRVFLLNNVHDKGGPQLFQTRWAMNYLAGPITRNRIQELNGLVAQPAGSDQSEVSSVKAAAPVASKAAVVDTTSSALAGYTRTPPAVPSGVDEFFLPLRYSLVKALDEAGLTAARDVQELGLVYMPALLTQADVMFTDRKGSFSENVRYAVLIDGDESGHIPFDEYAVAPFEPREVEGSAENDAHFAEFGELLSDSRRVKPIKTQFTDYVYREKALQLLSNEELALQSLPGESAEAFRERCEDAADKLEDAEVEKVRAKFEKELAKIKDKLRKEERELEEDQAKLQSLKMETMAKYGEAALDLAGSFLGGRRRRTSKISSSLTKRRQQQTARDDVEESIEEIEVLKKQGETLLQEEEEALEAVDQKWAEIVQQIETVNVPPYKKNIVIELFGVAWRPHWVVEVDGRQRTIVAG